MKAAVFKTLGSPLIVETVADPRPGPEDVVIKVIHCGVCASDLRMTEEAIFGVAPGTILGHEYAGEVIELGRQVERLRKGDRVTVLPVRSCGHCASCLLGQPAWCSKWHLEGGGYAQYALASERQCVRLPKTVSLEDGALVEPLAVGLHAVNISGLTPGARALVIGAGPIGLATAFWARRLGASKVAVTASSNRRQSIAHEMGATSFIEPAEDMAQAVTKALGGLPDIVYEAVGKPGLLAQSLNYVRPRGTVVLLGLCTAMDTFMPFVAVAKEVRIQSAAFYDMRDFEVAVDVLDAGVTTPRAMVTDTVPLDAMPEAFEALRHRTTQCKILVKAW